VNYKQYNSKYEQQTLILTSSQYGTVSEIEGGGRGDLKKIKTSKVSDDIFLLIC